MNLPAKPDGTIPALPDGIRQLVIIGANGAGKSRFTARLLQDAPRGCVYAMSPLRAMFGPWRADSPQWSIDGQYAAALARSPLLNARAEDVAPASEFERVTALLLQEEMAHLLEARFSDKEMCPVSKLDKVMAQWRAIFPGNDVMRTDGQLLFTSEDDDGRGQNRLSTGEKLVFYYLSAVLFAPHRAVIPVDAPEMFLHPSTMRTVWDRVEALRPDCTFIYLTHDLDFAATRSQAATVWVRAYNSRLQRFDYDLLPPDSSLSEEMYMAILGARRPVLFIEGDNTHSIDYKLYPLIFPECTVQALGSCDRVIESTRVFNSLGAFHHLDSRGIVDRDRRSPHEVAYLRRKKIMVPEVAEIENMFMLEEVVRTVASVNGKDEDKAFARVKNAVMNLFKADARTQALQHTRHQVKHTIEHCIDGRFATITKLEEHMRGLINDVKPRTVYDGFCREFHSYLRNGDYASVLRVYNQKSMIAQSGVGAATGAGDHRSYIAAVLNILKSETPAAQRLRKALRASLR